MPRFTVALSVGAWGGFYVHFGYLKRICFGWVALTFVPDVELDDLMEAYVNEGRHDDAQA
jgi:hypothetical protein